LEVVGHLALSGVVGTLIAGVGSAGASFLGMALGTAIRVTRGGFIQSSLRAGFKAVGASLVIGFIIGLVVPDFLPVALYSGGISFVFTFLYNYLEYYTQNTKFNEWFF